MKIEIKVPDLLIPRNHKVIHRGLGYKSSEKIDFAYFILGEKIWSYKQNSKTVGACNIYYVELVRTHRDEDGTPLDILPLPPIPKFVERVEYFGTDMSIDDMEDADCYIYNNLNNDGWTEYLKYKNVFPGKENGHYARYWLKKEEQIEAEQIEAAASDHQQLIDRLNQFSQQTQDFIAAIVTEIKNIK